jgi:hypothetical protein
VIFLFIDEICALLGYFAGSKGFLTLEDGTDISVRDFHSTLCNTPEERRSHQLRGGSLKSQKQICVHIFIYRHTDCVPNFSRTHLAESNYSCTGIEQGLDSQSTHISFIYHQSYINLAAGSVVRKYFSVCSLITQDPTVRMSFTCNTCLHAAIFLEFENKV